MKMLRLTEAQLLDRKLKQNSPIRDEEPKKKGAVGILEHDIQVAFMQLCRYHEHKYPALNLIYAVPNGGARNVVVAKKLKAEGVRAGVPDVHLPVSRKIWIGLWIEFKAGKNKLSQKQVDYIALLRSENHFVEICYSAEEAFKQVEKYLT